MSDDTDGDLSIDPAWTTEILTRFISAEVGRTGKSRVVLGLSGGIDSAVAADLAARALGPANVKCVLMPYRTSNPNSVSDAEELHTIYTDDTTVRCVADVKRAAEEADRDPASVRVWSCFATIGDHLPEDLRLKKTVGRMATYLQGYGDLMVKTNDWDPAVLQRFREAEAVTSIRGAIDQVATTEQLEQVAAFIPEAWLRRRLKL